MEALRVLIVELVVIKLKSENNHGHSFKTKWHCIALNFTCLEDISEYSTIVCYIIYSERQLEGFPYLLPEAEFLDVIETTVLRVFLLSIYSHLY